MIRSLLVGLLLSLVARHVEACQCGRHGTDAEALEQAVAVFAGARISSLTVLGESSFGPLPLQRYRFAVDRVWKGNVPSVFELVTNGNNCDFLFTEPGRYLVFVENNCGRTGASICLNTRRLTAEEAIPTLGPGLKVAPGSGGNALEPLYRPVWGTVLFLWYVARSPDPLTFHPYSWLLVAAFVTLSLGLLALAVVPLPIVGRRKWRRRLTAGAVLGVAVALILGYVYLWLSVWFSHLVV